MKQQIPFAKLTPKAKYLEVNVKILSEENFKIACRHKNWFE